MKILLIGNYAPDRQESMQRYADLLREGLVEAGHDVALALPVGVLNPSGRPASGLWKWLGYVDKYWLGVRELSFAARSADVVHVCDHSNSLYVPWGSGTPHVVTCHDLLAVRGALGEDTDCPASFTGRFLQRRILQGLKRAKAVACVSGATLRDAKRLLNGYHGRLVLTPNALNHPYRRLEPPVVREQLSQIPGLNVSSYVLHVGSNLRRKNRECALRALATVAASWDGRLVFAGQPLSPELRDLAEKLGIMARVVEVAKPDNGLLEVLYNGALALIFPSRFEGFGWPIIEAQACGCPVICSDREPLPEVSDRAAILCHADDHAAFGKAITDLAGTPSRRHELVRLGLENAARYQRPAMITRFVSLYEELLDNA